MGQIVRSDPVWFVAQARPSHLDGIGAKGGTDLGVLDGGKENSSASGRRLVLGHFGGDGLRIGLTPQAISNSRAALGTG